MGFQFLGEDALQDEAIYSPCMKHVEALVARWKGPPFHPDSVSLRSWQIDEIDGVAKIDVQAWLVYDIVELGNKIFHGYRGGNPCGELPFGGVPRACKYVGNFLRVRNV